MKIFTGHKPSTNWLIYRKRHKFIIIIHNLISTSYYYYYIFNAPHFTWTGYITCMECPLTEDRSPSSIPHASIVFFNKFENKMPFKPRFTDFCLLHTVWRQSLNELMYFSFTISRIGELSLSLFRWTINTLNHELNWTDPTDYIEVNKFIHRK